MATAGDDEPYLGVVLNDLDLSGRLPYDVAGWSLEKPTHEQIDSYRSVLSSFYAAATFTAHNAMINLPYEARKTTTDGKGITSYWDLPPEDWRYTVVRRVNPLISAASLTEAVRLSDADVWISFWPPSLRPATDPPIQNWVLIGSPNQVFQFIAGGRAENMPECPDLAEIAEIVELRRALDDDQFPEIARTIALFIETDDLPEHSTQKFLAYFGIIESLLTHAPKPNDLVDSLTRQLTRNILLLNNRLPDHRKLQLDTFKGAKPENVIKRLYSYRSAAAHGGDTADDIAWFQQNRPPSWLEINPMTLELHLFARSMAKRLLIAAMREPQLVQDLKAA